MIGGSQEIQDYVLKAEGLSRKGLNILCLIGAFVFGWLLLVAFKMLGKKKQGWFYVVPILGCLVISRLAAPVLGLLAPIIYIIGWIHTNVVLSGYQSSARDRIGQLDRLSGDKLTIDALLEKGILQQKVLGDGEAAASTLAKALQMPGGDGQLLNLAGVAMFVNERYAEAKQFFGRALSSVKDDALVKQVKLNLTNAEKKLEARSAGDAVPAHLTPAVTPIIKYLVILHLAIFLLVMAIPTSTANAIFQTFGIMPDSIISEFSIWQFLTYMFVHTDLWHLFFNMLFLWLFGREIEQLYGGQEFLFYYLTCGILGGMTYFLFNLGSHVPVIGSSAAVYGVMVAYTMHFPNERVINIIPIKSKYIFIFFTLFVTLSLVINFLSGTNPAGAYAELGGIITGFLYIRFRKIIK